jgi:TetR/AcrR family transcriptional repressor of nem operon
MVIRHDKKKVISDGIVLFCANSYSNLGVDEICKTTGMTKGAFYNSFKSKENFLLATMRRYGEMTVAYLSGELSNKDSSASAIDRLLTLYEGMFNCQPELNYCGCMINNIMSELGSSNPLVSEATAIEFDNFIQVIKPVVQEAQLDGDIDADFDSDSVAELLHSTFYGALTRAKSTREFNKGVQIMKLLISSLKSNNC